MVKQQNDQASSIIVRFITEAMAPGHFLNDAGRFHALRSGLDEALSPVGLRINDQGKVARARVATTLDEVAKLAGRLRTELTRREVHQEVLR